MVCWTPCSWPFGEASGQLWDVRNPPTKGLIHGKPLSYSSGHIGWSVPRNHKDSLLLEWENHRESRHYVMLAIVQGTCKGWSLCVFLGGAARGEPLKNCCSGIDGYSSGIVALVGALALVCWTLSTLLMSPRIYLVFTITIGHHYYYRSIFSPFNRILLLFIRYLLYYILVATLNFIFSFCSLTTLTLFITHPHQIWNIFN